MITINMIITIITVNMITTIIMATAMIMIIAIITIITVNLIIAVARPSAGSPKHCPAGPGRTGPSWSGEIQRQ